MLVDAEVLFERVERAAVLAQHVLADAHRVGVHAAVKIIPDRVLELGLVARLAQDVGIRLGHAVESRTIGGLGDSSLGRRRIEIVDPLLERLVGMRRRGGEERARRNERQKDGLQDRFTVTLHWHHSGHALVEATNLT